MSKQTSQAKLDTGPEFVTEKQELVFGFVGAQLILRLNSGSSFPLKNGREYGF